MSEKPWKHWGFEHWTLLKQAEIASDPEPSGEAGYDLKFKV